MLGLISGYQRLGKIKELGGELVTNLVETKEIMGLVGYKNYYLQDSDEVYGKPYLGSYLASLTSYFLSRQLAIKQMLTPNMLESLEDHVRLCMDNPVFYIKIKTNEKTTTN